MAKSIMQSERVCYMCGRVNGLTVHHVFAGVANRKISENYGLWVWLCHNCHTGRDGAQYNKEKNLKLKQDAQMAFQKYYGRKVWMQLIRKNYLGDWGKENESVSVDP
jgi:hypothetical protein